MSSTNPRMDTAADVTIEEHRTLKFINTITRGLYFPDAYDCRCILARQPNGDYRAAVVSFSEDDDGTQLAYVGHPEVGKTRIEVLKKVLRQVESKGDEMLQGLDEQERPKRLKRLKQLMRTQATHAPHPTQATQATGATPRKRPFEFDEAIDDTSDETLTLTTKMDIDEDELAAPSPTEDPAKTVAPAPKVRRQTRANTLKDTEKKSTASESLKATEKKTVVPESLKVTEKKTAAAKGKGKQKKPAEEERVSDPDTIHCKPRPARETAEEKLDSVLKKHAEAVKVGGSRKSGVGGKVKKGGVGKK